MKKTLILLAISMSFVFPTTWAQTADGDTPAEEDVCDGQVGAAFGLCNAYCEAMDCDSDSPNANELACLEVKDHFMTLTGNPSLPCENTCPCFTADDLAQLGDPGQQCGDVPGFPDLAGVVYTNGNRACSGFLCATVNTRSCATLDGEQVHIVDNILETEDADCRDLIYALCERTASPVQADSAAPSSGLFIDQ